MDKKYIDLHLHSFHSKRNGDVIQWLDEVGTLIKLRNKNVKAFAITDHDYFNFSLYKKFQETISCNNFNIIIFPGVEITLKRKNEERAHALFIFNNETSDEMLKKLEDIIHEHAHTNGTNIRVFVDELLSMNYDFTIIPHVGKCDSVIYEDVQEIMSFINYVESPISKNELTKFINESDKEIKPLMFSDTHKWNEYFGSKVFTDDNIINFNTIKEKLFYEGD